MLRELFVRGLGVLDDVSVPFGPGLCVLSGETGAGKTLLVTSLALLIGARADSRLVARGDASVEAVFAPGTQARHLLAERELDIDDELTVTRKLSRDGRSRAWLAGTLAPASTLAEVGHGLVEIHGQQEAFALARPQVQLDALDAFAGSTELRARFSKLLGRTRELRTELAEIVHAQRERERMVDALRFQVEEIERAQLDPGADGALDGELRRLEHADQLVVLAASANDHAGSDGAAALLGQAAAALADAARIDPAFAALADRARSLQAEAGDVASEARALGDEMDADPAAMEHLAERQALVQRLKRRYGESIADVLTFGAQARAELDGLERAGERPPQICEELDSLTPELDALATELTLRRHTAADALSAAVSVELPGLALPHAQFEITVRDGAETESGRDAVEFLFTANPGQAPAPISRVASGGELSRAMIAVTLALATSDPTGPDVLVFDEADAGVGGQAALELAKRLQRLGRTHQVLCVTHLAQIAAFADHHVSVAKTPERVTVRVLEGEARVEEISRMLAGLDGSDRARAHAAELLDLAAEQRSRADGPGSAPRRAKARKPAVA